MRLRSRERSVHMAGRLLQVARFATLDPEHRQVDLRERCVGNGSDRLRAHTRGFEQALRLVPPTEHLGERTDRQRDRSEADDPSGGGRVALDVRR